MKRQKVLVCGSTGFIGRSLVERFLGDTAFELFATYRKVPPLINNQKGPVEFIHADLRNPEDAARAIQGKDIVIQAAATTSGANVIINKPYLHVTDNAVMNAHILRACYEAKIKHVVFLSCTTMYKEQDAPVKEEDFNGEMIDKYFGVGWTKVYNEKMCEFYSRISPTKFTVIRHTNIYGPRDKFDLETAHVFGATMAKVMSAKDGKVVVWGDGSDERDFLYVEDLVNFMALAIENQEQPFELVNVGSGESISVTRLVEKIIEHSGRKLTIEYDHSKPSIGFKLKVSIDRAKDVFDWTPETSLDIGIERTLAWYRKHFPAPEAAKGSSPRGTQ
ncbi:MAG: NAD-dependent epimerase/dehydratase family protein [Candidatus Omnitrophota bacterium]|nr:NAD-dependent epimerase/dehydratase family protein [Candidatus Omnitrophota bacterium]